MSALSHFDELVIHATKEGWCFNLSCATCGNAKFRNGMEIIAQGKNPLKVVDRLADMDLEWRNEPELGSGRCLKLAGQVINANIERYHHDCRGFRWLGFLGLALSKFEYLPLGNREPDYLYDVRKENRKLILKLLSNSWTEKFLELLSRLERSRIGEETDRNGGEARSMCKKIMCREREPFQIHDLETMEGALLALRQNEPFNRN